MSATGTSHPENKAVSLDTRNWRKYVAMFYVIACGISWILWTPLVLGQDGVRLLNIAPPLPLLVCIGTLGPLIASYVTHHLQTGNWRAVRLWNWSGFRPFWLLLGPLLVLFCFFAVFPALLSKGSPDTWHWHVSAMAGIVVPMFNYNLFGGPLFEEFGWRGFLQPRLQAVFPPWMAAIAVGILWAVWHGPLFLLHWTSASPLEFLLIEVGLAIVMAFGFNASGKSVVVAILMHSAFNSSPRFLSGFLNGVPTRDHPRGELLIALSFLLVGAVLVLTTHGRLAADST